MAKIAIVMASCAVLCFAQLSKCPIGDGSGAHMWLNEPRTNNPPLKWCADEGGSCGEGPSWIWYGCALNWYAKSIPPGEKVTCTDEYFGCDPGPACAKKYCFKISNAKPWTDVVWEDYPFMALLKDAAGGAFCGASIISTSNFNGVGVILTAAHCVVDHSINDIKVHIGCTGPSSDPSRCIGTNVERYDVSSKQVHPDFSAANFDNDVAVLILNAPISHPEARAVELLTDDVAKFPTDVEEDIRLLGYAGLLLSDIDTLETATTTRVATGSCAIAMDLKLNRKHHMCVLDKKDRQTLGLGDSGSPALMRSNNKQIGINSFVYFKEGEFEPWVDYAAKPQGLAFVPFYVGWISRACACNLAPQKQFNDQNTLWPWRGLRPGESLVSNNGVYRAVLTPNGNLGVYGRDRDGKWGDDLLFYTNKPAQASDETTWLINQGNDGNVVLRRFKLDADGEWTEQETGTIWTTGADLGHQHRLTLFNSGELRLIKDNCGDGERGPRACLKEESTVWCANCAF